ncbi:kinase-like protein [Ramaria rubella]|nr:kinase-like protein [Ramaria rubella]
MKGFLYRFLFASWTTVPRCVRYCFWTTMYRIGRRLYGQNTQLAYRVPFGIFLKRGDRIRIQEGYATQYVGIHTNVPVPTVLDILEYNSEVMIALTRLPGEILGFAYRDMSNGWQLDYLSSQLRSFFNQRRSLPPPSNSVCAFMDNPIHDVRISMELRPHGPWTNVEEFHKFLVRQADLKIPDDERQVIQTIQTAHSRKHRICFTHSDFHPENMLVDDNGTVTGILDWEGAGWMPEYWDYTRAHYIPYFRKGRWNQIMAAAIPGYDLESNAEKFIWKYRQFYS